MSAEEFNEEEINRALASFLKLGESSYRAVDRPIEGGHRGYFSGSGWAARCLRYHLKQRGAVALPRVGESPIVIPPAGLKITRDSLVTNARLWVEGNRDGRVQEQRMFMIGVLTCFVTDLFDGRISCAENTQGGDAS